jgi:hypothetical protein
MAAAADSMWVNDPIVPPLHDARGQKSRCNNAMLGKMFIVGHAGIRDSARFIIEVERAYIWFLEARAGRNRVVPMACPNAVIRVDASGP